MRVAITGTPGTGKTTATDHLSTDLDIVHLNEVVKREDLTSGEDAERGTLVADLDAVREWFGDRDDVVVESHLAHQLAVDRVVVLRCHPETLSTRLRDRGEPAPKAQENAESEALDVVLAEAVERHGLGSVYEIETTDLSPEAVAREIERVLTGDREPSAGDVTFIEYL